MTKSKRTICGDWMGAIYGPHGERTEWILSLLPDGVCHKTLDRGKAGAETTTGTWRLHDDQVVLELGLEEDPDNVELWCVSDINGCEGASTLLVLRELVIASRNLPIVLYRVHNWPHDA